MITKSFCTPIFLCFLFATPSVAIVFVSQPPSFNAFCSQCANQLLGIPSTVAITTPAPSASTQNVFQRAGWETDDKGNVFVGTDDSKLLLISVGSYWPFPKDYRKK